MLNKPLIPIFYISSYPRFQSISRDFLGRSKGVDMFYNSTKMINCVGSVFLISCPIPHLTGRDGATGKYIGMF